GFHGSDAFSFGTPLMGYKNGKPQYMAPHAIYDTSYLLYDLGSIMTLDVPVYNEVDRYYGTGDIDPKTGAIIELTFSKSGFDMVHFDVFGTDLSGKVEFAPFSHDAEDGPVRTPEPASVALVLTGLAGALGLRNKRR
ncbi:MAG TPA: choice-of-anchor N protein, partial [Candidatus Omnitrophota bacterium]|nr:choice-of-anchor N protein [Candidatus Omnitrophota bacterium]